MGITVIILAAGRGTRMCSDRPKVLHEIGQAPLLHHAMKSAAALDPDLLTVVVGHGAEEVTAAAHAHSPGAKVVIQEAQRGTAHAVLQAKTTLERTKGPAVVLYGDTPLLSAETLTRLVESLQRCDVAILGFKAADPGRYGRLITDGDELLSIVEFKDASPEEKSVTLCNSGVISADGTLLLELLGNISDNNAAGEFYLTDIPALARACGKRAEVVMCDEAETLGVNTRADLAQAEAAFQAKARQAALARGTTLQAPDTVHFSYDTQLDQDVIVEPNVVFGPGVQVASGAQIRAFSHLEGCSVATGAVVGPFARLRPGTTLGTGARVGNFVEIKATALGDGAKVNHLSYIGDAMVGAAANIGAGTVTCNYDGVGKHKTTIGDGAFIGSDTMLVAPVVVGEEAMTASGSVITEDVEPGTLALGRSRQTNKPGLARKLMARLREAKRRGVS
ncbi:MAG: bifunctional UDP-N-acetylglucosamine diphosphorylase/glucosamine-1-phosphate N-acetyltransferase GlmU [Pseudomonadota bacterium]